MNLGEFRPPNQINKDEDKYWKFTKIQIIYMLAGFLIGVLIFRVIALLHIIILNIAAIIICVLLVGTGAIIGGVNRSSTAYLDGGGLRYDKYLFRKIKKRVRKRVIYTNNIDRDNPDYSYMKSEQYTGILSRIAKKLQTFSEG